jgi:hypothetical protein
MKAIIREALKYSDDELLPFPTIIKWKSVQLYTYTNTHQEISGLFLLASNLLCRHCGSVVENFRDDRFYWTYHSRGCCLTFMKWHRQGTILYLWEVPFQLREEIIRLLVRTPGASIEMCKKITTLWKDGTELRPMRLAPQTRQFQDSVTWRVTFHTIWDILVLVVSMWALLINFLYCSNMIWSQHWTRHEIVECLIEDGQTLRDEAYLTVSVLRSFATRVLLSIQNNNSRLKNVLTRCLKTEKCLESRLL